MVAVISRLDFVHCVGVRLVSCTRGGPLPLCSPSAAPLFFSRYLRRLALSCSRTAGSRRFFSPSARCFSAHSSHRVWLGMALLLQATQSPSFLACSRYSWEDFLFSSLRSGVCRLSFSYSFRSRFGLLAGLSSFGSALFFPVFTGVLGFLPGLVLCCIFPGRGKENWKVRPSTRLRGGTEVGPEVKQVAIGLSPRLRGNHLDICLEKRREGSIPAPAGEPPGPPGRPASTRVYPRACGGTTERGGRMTIPKGLSPRLRGNPDGRPARAGNGGSIPAPAGEPPCCCRPHRRNWVYPRACGGTRPMWRWRKLDTGLSPRLRGNQPDPQVEPNSGGSIPAPAGEPAQPRHRPRPVSVYPRACGGTPCRPPRVRRIPRSIPAPAGEPSPLSP